MLHSKPPGVDSAWEQEKLEARKMLENAPESHLSSASKEIAREKSRLLEFAYEPNICLLENGQGLGDAAKL
jgi:hypothetical protein